MIYIIDIIIDASARPPIETKRVLSTVVLPGSRPAVPTRALDPTPRHQSLCRTQNPLSDDSRTRPSPERRPFKRPFLFSTHSHVASRGSGGGATVAKPTRSDAGTVLHTFRTLCAVRSCCLATGGAARCSAAGERLIAGHRPTAFGRVASAGVESDCVLEVLECSLTPWAPRSDLHHRSGQGAF
jgi:hypothetical protein